MSTIPTAQLASVVYGDGIALDDPAESYHEAAKLQRSSAGRDTRGIRLLETQTELWASVTRASRRRPHLPRVPLPPIRLPQAALEDVLRDRRSRPPQRGSTLTPDELGAVLFAAYGIVAGEPERRAAPSAGALYPLGIYVLALRVTGIESGIYHFDQYDLCLERLPHPWAHAGSAFVDPELGENAAALIVIAGMFHRARFKYGIRGYRFALLETGHVAQNALLCAEALGLDALPLGGFYDSVVRDHRRRRGERVGALADRARPDRPVMTSTGLWVRIGLGAAAAAAALVLLEVPPPTAVALPPPLAAALGILAGTLLFLVLARRAPTFTSFPPSLRIARAGFILGWAAVEEILWRWLALGSLSVRTGAPIALLASSLGFACAHASGRPGHLATGSVFGAVYLASGQLLAPVLAHATYNALLVESLGRSRLERRTG